LGRWSGRSPAALTGRRGGLVMAGRILVVAPRLDTGGAEIHLARILPALRRAGLDISLFTMSRGGRLEQDIVDGGVPVVGAKIAGAHPMHSPRTAYNLRREVRRLKPDILHFFLPEPYLVGSLATAGLGGMIKIMSRRSLADYQRNHPVLAKVERYLHRYTNALIGNSSAVAAQLVAECGNLDKVGVIHNGIELAPRPEPATRVARRRELDIPEDAFVIATIASLIPYKGHSDLLAAMASARGRLRGAWRLIVVGRDEGIGQDLKRQAQVSGIDQNVLWLGERTDPQELLAAADLGVLPSHQEGFSNSLIEKMAQGLAVVATRVGGNCDAIIDGESGWLVPVAEPTVLGDAIATLYEDPGLRARMGAAARKRVECFFTLEACVRRYLNLYVGIAAGRAVPVAQLINPSDEEAGVSVELKGLRLTRSGGR
jgi:glycosyltransferase involved in cell wall biosynthesis